MKILTRRQAKLVEKSYADTWHYYRKEYEIHYNEQFTKSVQTWHHHEKIFETLFILEGKLQLIWQAGGKLHKKIVRPGDLIETGRQPHTFVNRWSKPVKLLVFKQVLTGRNKRSVFKRDKFIDPLPAGLA